MLQVSVKNSGKSSEQAYPFGYLKASSNLSIVNLVVLPFDYPTILRLLDELINVHKNRPTMTLRSAWEQYLSATPSYYLGPLRRALNRMSLHGMLPDVVSVDNSLSYGIISYLKRLKNQAKLEYEKIVSSVGKSMNRPMLKRLVPITGRSDAVTNAIARLDVKDASKAAADVAEISRLELNLNTVCSTVSDDYDNPFNIPRCRLLTQLHRQRASLGNLCTPDPTKHAIAVGQMGNYQEFVRLQPAALRSIGNQPARMNTFGNPFKVNKNLLSVDEADEAVNSPDAQFKMKPRSKPDIPTPSPVPGGKPNDLRKRKAGPLSKELSYRTLLSPIPSRNAETFQSRDVKRPSRPDTPITMSSPYTSGSMAEQRSAFSQPCHQNDPRKSPNQTARSQATHNSNIAYRQRTKQ